MAPFVIDLSGCGRDHSHTDINHTTSNSTPSTAATNATPILNPNPIKAARGRAQPRCDGASQTLLSGRGIRAVTTPLVLRVHLNSEPARTPIRRGYVHVHVFRGSGRDVLVKRARSACGLTRTRTPRQMPANRLPSPALLATHHKTPSSASSRRMMDPNATRFRQQLVSWFKQNELLLLIVHMTGIARRAESRLSEFREKAQKRLEETTQDNIDTNMTENEGCDSAVNKNNVLRAPNQGEVRIKLEPTLISGDGVVQKLGGQPVNQLIKLTDTNEIVGYVCFNSPDRRARPVINKPEALAKWYLRNRKIIRAGTVVGCKVRGPERVVTVHV